MSDPLRTMFVYWGRRGGVNRLALEAWQLSDREPLLDAHLSISRQNECFNLFAEKSGRMCSIDTFKSGAGAILGMRTLPVQRRALREYLRKHQIEAVVTWLSHVWTPFFTDVFRNSGARTTTIVHDAMPHPGDPTGVLQRWYQGNLDAVDHLVTLSQSVTEQLAKENPSLRSKTTTLFHPNFDFGHLKLPAAPKVGEPLRLLFLGRILPYKGLGLLIEAVKQLRDREFPVTLGVFGEGELGQHRDALQDLQAEVVNRWLSDNEIDAAISRYHAIALSHLEASQSGVAALAAGRGLPIVARPVGGIVEQVIDGKTGVIASGLELGDFMTAIVRLATQPGLYDQIVQGVLTERSQKSVRAFVRALSLDLQADAAKRRPSVRIEA